MAKLLFENFAINDCYAIVDDRRTPLASMTIRNIDDHLEARLRIRPAAHGRSLEDEIRNILRAALSTEEKRQPNLADAIRRRIAAIGGIVLEIAPRELSRPLEFDP